MLEQLNALAILAKQHWPMIIGQPELVMHRENTVYRVNTTSGAAALRLHREGYHSQAALQSELDWMAMLARGGMQVPEPLPTKDRQYLVRLTSSQGISRNLDMLSWMAGTPLGKSYAKLDHSSSRLQHIFQQLGASLAQMHNLSDVWQRPLAFERPSWDRQGIVGAKPFWGEFWSISDISKDDTRTLDSIRECIDLELIKAEQNGADYGLIHADLARENILIDADQVRIIDFNDSGFGFRMFDIATALIKNRNEPDYLELVNLLFDGYETLRPLAKSARDTLPLFMVARSLTYLGWAEARRHEPGMDVRRSNMIAEALKLSREFLAARLR